MKEVKSCLYTEFNDSDRKKTIGENIAAAKVIDREVIHTKANAYSQTAALAILYGNIAPEGAAVKAGAVPAGMLKFKGPAKVFNSEEEVTPAIMKGKIKTVMWSSSATKDQKAGRE